MEDSQRDSSKGGETSSVENLEAKETMDAINRLLDYHERVNKTRSSALDYRAFISLINSLLLPVVAFLLGNLDKILALLRNSLEGA